MFDPRFDTKEYEEWLELLDSEYDKLTEILEKVGDASYDALNAIKNHLKTGNDELLLDAIHNLTDNLAILER